MSAADPRRVTLYRPGSLLPEHLARWDALVARAAEPNVYLEPAYFMPMHGAAAEAETVLAVLEDGETWDAVLAVARQRHTSRRIPYSVWSTRGTFLDLAVGRIHPLIDGDDPHGTWEAFLRGLGRAAGPGLLWLSDFFVDGPLGAAMTHVEDRGLPVRLNGHGYRAWQTAGRVVDGETPDVTAAHLSTRRRKEHARYRRQLEQTYGGALEWRDAGTDPEAIERFMTVQASGWKGDAARGGTAYALSPARTQALRAVAAAYRSRGELIVGELHVGDHLVHSSVSLRRGAHICGVMDAYNDADARMRAGSLGRMALLNAMALMHPGCEYDPTLQTNDPALVGLFPDRRPMAGALIGLGGRAAGLWMATMDRVLDRRATGESDTPAATP